MITTHGMHSLQPSMHTMVKTGSLSWFDIMTLEQGLDFDTEENSQSRSFESNSTIDSSSRSSKSLLKDDLTDSDQENADMTPREKCVSFEKVLIRSYDRVVGDHPCCRSGLPISFGWEILGEETWDFEEYQENEHRSAASKSSFWLSPRARENLGLEQDDKSKSKDRKSRYRSSPKLSTKDEIKEAKPAIHRRTVRRKHPRQKKQQKSGESCTKLSRRPRMWMPLQTVN